MRKCGNEEKLGRRKPVEPVLQLHVVVVVAFDVEVCPSIVQKFARRSCFQTDCIKFAGQYDA